MDQTMLMNLAVLNIIALGVCGLDKWKARRGAWRVPEKTLFLFALFGGGWGIWAGMYLFRHKTRRWYFVLGIPLIIFVEYGIAAWLLLRG